MNEKIEYVFDTILTSHDGDAVYIYDIYEKNGKNFKFVDRSTKYFFTMEECNKEAENHINMIEQANFI